MPDEGEAWAPGFKPGWPDLYPIGLIVGRLAVMGDPVPDSAEDESDDVSWVLHLGVSNETPRLAILGDLTIRDRDAGGFGGVTILMPFSLRSEPEEITPEFSDGVLRQYGDWASSFMYDYAAANLRSALGGAGITLEVPFATPDAQLHTSDLHANPSGEDTSDS